MKRNDNKPLGCGFCPYKTNSACHLERHLRIHTGHKPYACDTCDYRATDGGLLKRHMRIHSGEKPFKCHICGHQTAQSCSLKDHMAVHTGKKRYACELCPFQCSRIGRLRDHQVQHKLTFVHTINKNAAQEPPSNEVDAISEKKNPLLCSCPTCGLEFSEPLYLKTHMTTIHSSDEANQDSGAFGSTVTDAVDLPMDESNSTPYACTLCFTETDSLDDLNNHTSRHISYKCLKCANVFETSDELIAHGYTHNRELLYPCDFCDFKSKTRNELRGHERTHNNCQAFMCSDCEFVSRSKREFSQHLQTHTSKDKVQCNICSKTFKDTSTLKDHMSFHYGRQRVPKRIIHELQEAEEFLGSASSYLCFYCSLRCRDKHEMEKHIQDVHFFSSSGSKTETVISKRNSGDNSKRGALIVHPGVNLGSLAMNAMSQLPSQQCETASGFSSELRTIDVDPCVQCLKDEGFNYLLKFYSTRQNDSLPNQTLSQSWFPSHPYDQLLPFFMNDNWSNFSHSSHCTKPNSLAQVKFEEGKFPPFLMGLRSPLNKFQTNSDASSLEFNIAAESALEVSSSSKQTGKIAEALLIKKDVFTCEQMNVPETTSNSKKRKQDEITKGEVLTLKRPNNQDTKPPLTRIKGDSTLLQPRRLAKSDTKNTTRRNSTPSNSNESGNKNAEIIKSTRPTAKHPQSTQGKRNPTRRKTQNVIQIVGATSKTVTSDEELPSKSFTDLYQSENEDQLASGDVLLAKLRKFFNESAPTWAGSVENLSQTQTNSSTTNQAHVIELSSETNTSSSSK